MSAPSLLVRGAGSIGDLAGPRSVLVEDGRIAAIDEKAEERAPSVDRALDASGLVVAPGFVELQINGAAGRDFTLDPVAMWEVGDTLARSGVTSFLPTVITGPPDAALRALDAYRLGTVELDPSGAVPLGLHLEGPFLAEARRGAHDPDHLRDPDAATIDAWISSEAVRIVTLAPERPGALEAIARLAEAGIVASVGHTAADAATTTRAVDAGARMATHLFNAMPPLGHRDPGAAGVLLDDERVTLGLIADGVHLDPLVLRLVHRAAPGRIAVVSDAIASLGRAGGIHRLGNRDVVVRDGAARLADGTIAGSAAGLDAGVRGLAAATDSVRVAVEAATSTPARLLGLSDGRGAIAVGGRADLVVLDEALRVRLTLVAGAVVHESEGLRWA
jgi:N-acetylglucosamine-6-phosphate deacetylase